MQPAAEERLVSVDVANASDHSLIKNQGLDRCGPSDQFLGQVPRTEPFGEGLRAESGLKMGLGEDGMKENPAELALIRIAKSHAIVEHDREVLEADRC